MNCLVIEYSDEMILIDCGVQFPDQTYTGVDILLPDLNYVYERLDKLKAVVVTHGHDDHIGAIPYLARKKDIDVYATPFPTGLIKNKLIEITDTEEIRFHEIKPRKEFQIGSFKFDPIPVQHSIIEALAFAIQTPVGTIIHSGDFKHDEKETSQGHIGFGAFEEWGKKGVLLLMSDSTNAERTGHTLSEIDISKSFDSFFKNQKSRLIIALFASNIRRVERLIALASQYGKKVALMGRSMHSYTKLAFDQESMKLPASTLVPIEDIERYKESDLVVLATGSQAEPKSALLRVSQGIHKHLKIRSGDLVVMSSRFIPGNERAITNMIDDLYRQGAEVLYESVHHIHVSGHGFQDELLMMLNATKPKFFIPIHGCYRHMKKHSNLAVHSGVQFQNSQVIENGQIVELTKHSLTLGEHLPLQRGILFEGVELDAAPEQFQQRLALSKTGVVSVVILRKKDSKSLIIPPAVHTYGLLYRKPQVEVEVIEEARRHLDAVCKKHKKDSHTDLEDVLRLETRRFFKNCVSHKPTVLPLIVDL